MSNSAEQDSPPVSGAEAAQGAAPVESPEALAHANRPFRGWRLLGVIGIVVVILALVSAIVDWMVIGPLEGRVF